MADYEIFFGRANALKEQANKLVQMHHQKVDAMQIGREYWAFVEADTKLRNDMHEAGVRGEITPKLLEPLSRITQIRQEFEEYYSNHPDNPKLH